MEHGWGKWLVAVSCALCAATPVWAGDPGVEAEIEVLKARLAKLEQQVSAPEFQGTSSIGAKGGLPTLELPSGLQGLGISGYVDTAYEYNFNRPDTGATGRTVTSNNGRVFDRVANNVAIHAAELVLEKPLSDTAPIGFRTDLFFGDDAEQIHSTGLGDVAANDNPLPFDLQQAYVSARIPIGAGLDVKAGKFVTLLGAEVIESPANWNYSRSFLFGYAIPFTHTGALASYPVLGEYGSATFGVVNGWDLADENNSFKTMLGNLTLTPVKGVSLSSNFITGAERASNNRDDRTVLDFVATWQPLEKLTLMANYDYGHQSNLIHGGAGTKGPDAANWSGVALYTKYDLTDKWSLAGRWEWFNDADAVRTALTGPDGATLDNLHFTEYTLTSQWQLFEHLLARLEYRHDGSNERVFFRNSAGFKTTQDTVAAELIYHF